MTLFKLDNYKGIDISDKKIYLDTEMKQFRHKLKCELCGISVGCKCYNTISEAIEDNEFACWCNKCSIREAIRDGDRCSLNDVLDILDNSESQDRIDKIIDFALSTLTEKEIEELAKSICDFDDCCDEFIGDICNV